MNQEIRALILHSQGSPLGTLRNALENHSIQTDTARTCKEAAWRLRSSDPPHLVFTAAALPDGTWSEVLDLASEAPLPVSVIVVSPVADVPLYIAVMERRAFDFITHSFDADELAHILRSASENVVRQRRERKVMVNRAAGKELASAKIA